MEEVKILLNDELWKIIDIIDVTKVAKISELILAEKGAFKIISKDYSYSAETTSHAALYLMALASSDTALLNQIRSQSIRRAFALKLLYFMSEVLGEDTDLECLGEIGVTPDEILSSKISMEEMVTLIRMNFGKVKPSNKDTGTFILQLTDTIGLKFTYERNVEDYEKEIDGVTGFLSADGKNECSVEQIIRIYLGLEAADDLN